MLVISIQSQVVTGHVGNSAAVYPMQAEGVTVAAVPTTLLSNHPRYPTTRGRVLDADLVADLLLGVEERGLIEQAAVLITGYLGSPAIAAVVADFAERALERNPKLVYLCDPLMRTAACSIRPRSSRPRRRSVTRSASSTRPRIVGYWGWLESSVVGTAATVTPSACIG